MTESGQGSGRSSSAGDDPDPAAFPGEPLSTLERALVDSVAQGIDFTPSYQDARWRGDWNKGIRGGLIRALLLGTEFLRDPKKKTAPLRKAKVTAHGIRILACGKRMDGRAPAHPATPLLTIRGKLDLAHLGAESCGCLPPLELSGCRFERPVELSGVRLQSLTLRGSCFSQLRASGAKIDGAVILAGCGPCSYSSNPAERCRAVEDLARFGKAGEDGRVEESYNFVATRPMPPGTEQGCECASCKENGKTEICSLYCVIDLSSATIAGGLLISGTYLRAPKRESEKHDPNIRACCAADFSHALVRDRLEIVHCTFEGGASFVSIEVEDDIWISGGKFLAAADSYVLDFQLAIVRGILALQAAAADTVEDPAAELGSSTNTAGVQVYPVVVVGQLTGINVNAGEIWVGEGFFYGRDQSGQGSFPSVNFAKSDIARSFKVGAYHPQHVLDPKRPTGEARIHGEICLAAANLGKNLELHGVDHQNMEILDRFFDAFIAPKDKATPAAREKWWDDTHLRLHAHGLKVDRRAYLSHAHFRDAPPATACAPADEGRKPPQPAAIDFWKSTIGTGFRLGEGCECIGAVRLNSCVIGRELNIACRRIESSAADCAAEEFLPEDIPVALDISESTIMGHVRIGRRVPRPEGGLCGDVAITVKGAVSLESSGVQGSLLLAHLQIDLSSDRQWTAGAQERRTGKETRPHRGPRRVALNLRDCTCGSELEVHEIRWILPPLEQGEAPPPRAWSWSPKTYKAVDGNWFAVIDLRGLQCDLLVDRFGAGWALEYRLQLRLAGIRIGDVEPPSYQSEHAIVGKRDEIRLRWLAFQQARQRAVEQPSSAKDETPQSSPPAPQPKAADRSGFWARSWTRFYCSAEEHFFSQPYDTFATANRKAGEDSAAEAMLVEKKNVYNVVRFHRLRRKWYFISVPVVAGLLLIAGGLMLGPLIGRSGLVPESGPDVRFVGIGIVAAGFVLLAWPFFVTLFQALFRLGFRYGLSPGAALISFSILIALGWIGVHKARNGGIATVTNWDNKVPNGVLDSDIALVLDVEYEPHVPEAKPTPPPPERLEEPEPEPCSAPQVRATGSPGPSKSVSGGVQAAAADAQTSKWPPDAVIEGQAIHTQPVPCNRNVSSLLYALDVFIPLIDLDQERRCSVRDADPATGHDAYFGWRVLKALYELLGWVVTSLVILTFTGVLRRDLER